jgi:hypothetical protein
VRRKSAKKPSCRRSLRRSNVAASIAILPAYSTYLGESGIVIATDPLAIIVAVAELAPTARSKGDLCGVERQNYLEKG